MIRPEDLKAPVLDVDSPEAKMLRDHIDRRLIAWNRQGEKGSCHISILRMPISGEIVEQVRSEYAAMGWQVDPSLRGYFCLSRKP